MEVSFVLFATELRFLPSKYFYMTDDAKKEYKTVVLIGGELHNIQIVVDKNQNEFEAVIFGANTWETKLYKQMNQNQFEFLLQE